MTRINTIDPVLLPSPWLVAEYRELPRIINRVASGTPTVGPFPDSYRMGKGHVTFFFDKLHWLYQRHAQLRNEMFRRQFKPLMQLDDAMALCMIKRPDLCRPEVWQPSVQDHLTCMARLQERWKGTDVDWVIFAEQVRHHHNLPAWSN